jgi:hypothetical protein
MLVLFMLKILFTCFTVRSTFTEIRVERGSKTFTCNNLTGKRFICFLLDQDYQ